MTVNGFYVGLMSGTSLDGIDAAVVKIENNHVELLGTLLKPWPTELKSALRNAIEIEDSLDNILRLDQQCAQMYAQASLECIRLAGLKPDNILAIGSHGQTIRHSPGSTPSYTLQIGNPNTIAELTGITTVADFRSRDIAAGGQGAPLAPAFHHAVFFDPDKTRAVVNIGGIANITLLGSNCITGYDTGPGNRLLDDWIRYSTGRDFDELGAFAAAGNPITELLKKLLDDPYFAARHPKSTGSDYFNLQWLLSRLSDHQDSPAENIQATLAALTAVSITDQLKTVCPDCDEVLVCGGGAHNKHLLKLIQKQLGNTPVFTTEKYGIDPDWVEAMAFAWLARQTLTGLPGNIPSVTGARGPRVCGGIYTA